MLYQICTDLRCTVGQVAVYTYQIPVGCLIPRGMEHKFRQLQEDFPHKTTSSRRDFVQQTLDSLDAPFAEGYHQPLMEFVFFPCSHAVFPTTQKMTLPRAELPRTTGDAPAARNSSAPMTVSAQPEAESSWGRINGLVLRENLNRKPSIFPWNMGLSCKLSSKNQSIDRSLCSKSLWLWEHWERC